MGKLLMRSGAAIAAALLATTVLAACGSEPEDESSEELSGVVEDVVETGPEPAPTPTPTPDLFPAIGTITSDLKDATGYHATLTASWSSIVKLPAAEASELLPECTKWIDLMYKTGATDGFVYATRVSGEIEYPVVDGFQWPEPAGIEFWVERLGGGSGYAQKTCEEPYIDKTDGVMPTAPDGGEFTRTRIWVEGKTPANPNGDLQDSAGGGMASPDIPVQDYVNGQLVLKTFTQVECTNASEDRGINKNVCRFPMPTPLS